MANIRCEYPSGLSGPWRLRITGLGALVLLYATWRWGTDDIEWMFPAGLFVAIVGLLLRIWATGWLIKDTTLVTTGPYAITRNPLYLGTGLITVGQSLMSGLPWAVAVFPALYYACYAITMREEAAFLRRIYGEQYDAYAAAVPLFIPRLWPRSTKKEKEPQPVIQTIQPEQTDRLFSWKRVRRCYKGFLANALLIGVYAVLLVN